jgi:hypothetical protein
MPAIAFIDEEAGGLQHFKDFVWEIGLVLRTYDYKWNLEERKEFQWNPLPVGINLEAFAHTPAGKVTNFARRKDDIMWHDPAATARQVAKILDGAILVSNNTTFDETFLMRFLQENTSDGPGWSQGSYGKEWSSPWYYHAIDIMSVARGFLAAKGIHEPDYSGVDGFANAAPPLFREKSEFFSAAMGVEPPDPKEHHQALPDAVAGFRGLAAGEK